MNASIRRLFCGPCRAAWAAAGASTLLLAFPAAAARGAARGIALCLNTAVPSLFPFMVLAAYVSASGAAALPGRLLRRPVGWLGLPPQAAGTVVLALLGGYPVGAAGVSRLLREKQLTLQEAQRAMALCCLPSPAFMITAVGNGLLGSPKTGAVLWACTLLGAVAALPRRRNRSSTSAPAKAPPLPVRGALTQAVNHACRSTLSLCACIVLFCTLQGVLEETPLPGALAFLAGKVLPAGAAGSLLPVVLEVTTGVQACRENGAPLWLYAFGAGWGGLCVHGQVFSFFSPGELKKGPFLRARLVHGTTAGLLAWGVFRLFPGLAPATAAFAGQTGQHLQLFSAGAPAAAALLALCAVFCLTVPLPQGTEKAESRRSPPAKKHSVLPGLSGHH